MHRPTRDSSGLCPVQLHVRRSGLGWGSGPGRDLAVSVTAAHLRQRLRPGAVDHNRGRRPLARYRFSVSGTGNARGWWGKVSWSSLSAYTSLPCRRCACTDMVGSRWHRSRGQKRGERRAGAVGGRVSRGRGLAPAVTTTAPFGRGSRGLVLLGAEAPANRLSPMEEGFDERFGVSA